MKRLSCLHSMNSKYNKNNIDFKNSTKFFILLYSENSLLLDKTSMKSLTLVI